MSLNDKTILIGAGAGRSHILAELASMGSSVTVVGGFVDKEEVPFTPGNIMKAESLERSLISVKFNKQYKRDFFKTWWGYSYDLLKQQAFVGRLKRFKNVSIRYNKSKRTGDR